MNSTKFAWMAGIWEGEGCVRISSRKPSVAGKDKNRKYWLFANVANTQRDMLTPFLNEYGGYLRTSITDRAKPMYYWNSATRTTMKFLEDILPYVVTAKRRAQVLLAIEFQRQKRRGGTYSKEDVRYYADVQRQYFEKMKELHR